MSLHTPSNNWGLHRARSSASEDPVGPGRGLQRQPGEPGLHSQPGPWIPLAAGPARQLALSGVANLQSVLQAPPRARGAGTCGLSCAGHVALLVSSCSISSKSRCSDGATRHRRASLHLPSKGGRLHRCWLPTSCQPCRPLCCAPTSSLNSESRFPSGCGPARCQRLALGAGSAVLPIGSRSLAGPPAGPCAQRRRGSRSIPEACVSGSSGLGFSHAPVLDQPAHT